MSWVKHFKMIMSEQIKVIKNKIKITFLPERAIPGTLNDKSEFVVKLVCKNFTIILF